MEYFASLPAEALAQELTQRIESYYSWVLTTGRLQRWRTAYDTYYGRRGQHQSTYITPGGDAGELSLLMCNEFGSLVNHLLVMAFEQRPSLETVSTNTDSKAKASAYVAKGLVEYYRRDGKMDANARVATEISLLFDTGWVINLWDLMLGQDIAADMQGKLIRQGDINSRARTPLEVVVDVTKPQGNDRDWILFKDPVNKFDLAAQWSEKAEMISGLSRDRTKDALYRFGDVYDFDDFNQSSPDIDVWTFVHRRSPALPQGRLFQFSSPRATFFDGPTPYRKLPGNRICPREQILSPLGYSNCNDLISLQDVIDALVSAAVTNMTTCGVNTIWTKPSPNFDFQELAKGMTLIEADEKPEALVLNKLPPEWFNLANWIISRMEAISGLNSVARGNTQGKEFSGAAMALLQSMAIQFNSGLTQAVNGLYEANGNDVIMLTQDFAKEERLGMIIGRKNRYMMKKYSGADIKSVQRVYARQSNAMKDTTAGKMQLLTEYKEIGAIKYPAQITEVLETGQLESVSEGPRNLALAIDEENEAIINGDVPPVIFTDNHPEHMLKHAELFCSPTDRQDPELLKRARLHFDLHNMEWQKTNPAILMALGIPPYPAPMMGGLPPGPMSPEGTPNPTPAPEGPESPQPQPGHEPVVEGGPTMPENPLTGQPFDTATGGLGA